MGDRTTGRTDPLSICSLIAELSSQFINLAPKDVDSAIEDAQRRVCQALGLDLCSVWQWTRANPEEFTITHLYRGTDGPPIPGNFLAREAFPWTYAEIMAGREIVFNSLRDLPSEAAGERELRRQLGICSSATFPLAVGRDSAFGAVTFNTRIAERQWAADDVTWLRSVAQVFANALARKLTNQILVDSKERLNLAADSAGAGLWELDCESKLFWTTDRGYSIFGFPKGKPISMDEFLESVHPDDRIRVRKAVEEALQTSGSIDQEYRIQPGTGIMKWIASTGRFLGRSDGRPDRLMGLSVDITTRKKEEAALKRSLAEIKQLKEQLEVESSYLRAEVKAGDTHGDIIGRSPSITQVIEQLEQVAPTDSSVLLTGETGTGKDLVASEIHRHSRRRDRVFVKVNCASLPDSLVESELFGREKGAFTGALTRQVGRFEVANGSTLFLDEVSEISLEVQAKLLRVLQDGAFERLGSTRTMKTDVRIIAATNRDLKAEMQAGRFRPDLFYRLSVFPIHVPPLRDRPEDIPALVWTFLEDFTGRMGKRITKIPEPVMEALQRHFWPGNVRELRNVIERSTIITTGSVLNVPTLDRTDLVASPQSLEEVERTHIENVLRQTHWRVKGPQGAAAILGLNPSTLYSRMQKLGIPRSRER